MTRPKRAGRRVALVAKYPEPDPAMPSQFISNHGMRMVEATLRASDLSDLEVRAYDVRGAAVVGPLYRVLSEFDPDVVGFSSYLWSFPDFVELAARLREDDPGRVLVFGGPSARPSMFALEPFADRHHVVDALVIDEGERSFIEIVALPERTPEALAGVAGLSLPDGGGGWISTGGRPLSDLDDLPSPYALKVVPRGGLGVLQTYRGCPFTCSFCEWGVLESPDRVRSVASIVEEFGGMDRHRVEGALLVDAGLNLNQRAFRNLAQASKETDFFADKNLICEVYPLKVNDDHLEFLSRIGVGLVGVGLQSFDNEVLAKVERTYDEARFEERIHALGEIAGVAIEIILGLPGDNATSFRRTYERARSLPCALRVYHCVVLPSALMVRAPPEFALDFDPVSLKMRSCLGWTEEGLAAEAAFITEQTRLEGGFPGRYLWTFPPP